MLKSLTVLKFLSSFICWSDIISVKQETGLNSFKALIFDYALFSSAKTIVFLFSFVSSTDFKDSSISIPSFCLKSEPGIIYFKESFRFVTTAIRYLVLISSSKITSLIIFNIFSSFSYGERDLLQRISLNIFFLLNILYFTINYFLILKKFEWWQRINYSASSRFVSTSPLISLKWSRMFCWVSVCCVISATSS